MVVSSAKSERLGRLGLDGYFRARRVHAQGEGHALLRLRDRQGLPGVGIRGPANTAIVATLPARQGDKATRAVSTSTALQAGRDQGAGNLASALCNNCLFADPEGRPLNYSERCG
jgi:hypothetical protein